MGVALVMVRGSLIRSAEPRFAVEAWLDATRLWGETLAALVPALVALAGGDRAGARRSGNRATALAAAVRDDRHPHRTAGVRLGDGVLDHFVADLCAMVSA